MAKKDYAAHMQDVADNASVEQSWKQREGAKTVAEMIKESKSIREGQAMLNERTRILTEKIDAYAKELEGDQKA